VQKKEEGLKRERAMVRERTEEERPLCAEDVARGSGEGGFGC
jgi:hypothetical protein